MFAILFSAFNAALAFIFRSIIIKFVVFFALYYVTTGFISVLQSSGILPSAANLTSSLDLIPSDVWYFINFFAISYGIKTVISAYAARFIIRRLPIIG